MIPENKLEEIIERVDLVSLISRHVELKQAGREFKGRCPFHQEKTPSFYVIPEKRFYFCHGCRASGDAVSFVTRYLGKNFLDAVRDLAREVGVDIEATYDPVARERQQLKEVTDLAAEHFRAYLWAEDGRAARAYLASRGVSEETAQAFGLGWAPEAWSLLADKLLQAGMIEWGLTAGLIIRRNPEKGDGYFDFFRSRLIVPIRAPEGRPIAFGGRIVGASESAKDGPKYLNSKESRLYNKSDTLYGMDQARDNIRRQKTAILVEGYFDCIGLHQAGVRNAVALCSTALTHGHLNALRRVGARDLVLLLDGDSAGLNAVERLAGPLLAAGASTRVALLPQGDDPDTFVRREGPEGVERLQAESLPLTTHLLTVALPAGTRSTFEEKMAALERLKAVLAQIPQGLERSALFEVMASYFGWTVDHLESNLRDKVPPPNKPAAPATTPAPYAPPVRAVQARASQTSQLHKLEAWYVAAILREPRLILRDGYRLGDELTHPGLRMVLAQATTGHGVQDALMEAAEPVKRALEHHLRLLPAGGLELEQAFSKICHQLVLKRIEDRLSYIKRATEQTPGSFDLTEETRQLYAERIELLALKKRVLEETRDAAAGTKAPMQPV